QSNESQDGQGLSGKRRQVLIGEAARLFAGKGYETTSMRDIAAAVGILPGSLYHHFPSKEELFVAVYSFAVAQTLDVVTRAIAS
ncbi:helix-turn-helix domain-containing protein, partial [Acinetobacter baumannii]